MPSFQHQNLRGERWFKLSFFEQMANVGSEVERAISWRNKNNAEYSRLAFERSLELMDFTVEDVKNRKYWKELLRLRECLVDYFAYDNEYGSSDEKWHNYFYAFNYAARRQLLK